MYEYAVDGEIYNVITIWLNQRLSLESIQNKSEFSEQYTIII